MMGGGGGEGVGDKLFDAQSKSAKIPNSLYKGDGVGAELLMLSLNLLKSQSPCMRRGGVGWGLGGGWKKTTSFSKLQC